MGYCRIRK